MSSARWYRCLTAILIGVVLSSCASDRAANHEGSGVSPRGTSVAVLSDTESDSTESRSQGSIGSHVVTLDFMTSGERMSVRYRVGMEEMIVEEIAGPFYSYTTNAELESSILATLDPTPETADSSITISLDGMTIGGSSRPGSVQRNDTAYPSSMGGENVVVILDFQTEGRGMTVTYRVGTEDLVTQDISGTFHSYRTEAPVGSTIVTLIQPKPSSAHSSIAITADGRTVGGSSRPGQVGRVDTLSFR